MIVRHHHEGHWYIVQFPERTRVHLSSLTGMTVLSVPWKSREIPIFDDPSDLIVELARSGTYGLRLVTAGATWRHST